MKRSVVLCGDSIFDNAAYVDGAPEVAAQLRALLHPDDAVTLLAVDGSVSEEMAAQFEAISADATHLIVSTGGNDILHHTALLDAKVDTVADALARIREASAGFADAHRRAVELAATLDLPVAFCTIYDANMGPLITTALSIFNDAITRNVHRAGVDLIDLRLVCTDAADYANPIEPSVEGGEKIAHAISRYVTAISEPAKNTRVFT